MLSDLGTWYLQGGQHRQALEHYQRALALEEQRVPARHPDLFGPLVGVGECQLALHAPAEARAALERALWDGGEEPRARELAALAQKTLLQAHKDSEASRVADWLQSHGGR